MTDRQGIEIDYCPTCRGVWLDRGELDKLLERASAQAAPAPPQSQPYPQQQQHYPPQHQGKPYYKKQKSWLSDIFD
jgi:Zn-finger nucleic acid-binding protein